MKYPFLAALLALGIAGCIPSESQLKVRAGYDFDCPADAIHLTVIDFRTRGVRGCGQRGTYVQSCQAGDCTWVLNGDVKRASDSD